MKEVFISYSSKEQKIADSIKRILEKNEIQCKMIQETNYSEEIQKEISNSKILLLILSKSAQESNIVVEEVKQAIEENKIIVPFLIEKCDLNDTLKNYLSKFEMIDAYLSVEKSVELLIKEIKVQLNQEEHQTITKKEVYGNGDVYEGTFKNNERDGKGKMTFSNGKVYEGEWKENEINGFGKMVFPDGVVYEGEWKNGMFEGRGVLTTSLGVRLEGVWKHNLKTKDFKMTMPREKNFLIECSYDFDKKLSLEVDQMGNYYEGEVDRGLRNGHGKYVEKKGYNYEGEWKNGLREGNGREVYEDKTYYEGEWKNDLKEGWGKQTYKDGGYYEGRWKNDMKHGKGILYNFLGFKQYNGYWEENRKVGKIKSIFKEMFGKE